MWLCSLGQSSNQDAQSLNGRFPRQPSQFDRLLPWIDVLPRKRRKNTKQHSVSVIPNRRK